MSAIPRFHKTLQRQDLPRNNLDLLHTLAPYWPDLAKFFDYTQSQPNMVPPCHIVGAFEHKSACGDLSKDRERQSAYHKGCVHDDRAWESEKINGCIGSLENLGRVKVI
jgi:hypothetical protein